MNPDRISQLYAFYKEDPTDPFNIYCLAIEYRDVDPEKAWQFFQLLLSNHQEYLPTYYHAAQHLIDRDEIDEAEKIIDDGIALATKLGDQLALRELINLLDNLLDY